ncbi:cytochrome b5-like heme/steroid binding domain-containing protein [Fusarium solani]|uniref:Cytochrome b5-like heme/steroid binding domain-containing protein n=1 Tax=Fusarium solani TaxID=169388 RepID=A0A9P9HV21_FUSSL|nr:cytochrome b5-like heme/steroid binding domain-containing protein [Fusarium solani]KAH7264558.1 cytochrome b5-like heme/steroid binding domain-containing protein [Fusarium solani]
MTATKYTLQDVAERNKDGTVYVAIHGKVYNCTRFIENHPGGAEAILEFAGTDASQPFDEIQHSGDALEILDTLCVGELESDLGKANDEMNQHLSRVKVTKSGVAGLGTVGNITLLLVFCLVVYYGASSYQSA